MLNLFLYLTDESAAPAKKKSNKEQSPLDKPKAKEEKKQAEAMAKKIADTIKVSLGL